MAKYFKRLYKDYTHKFIYKILLSIFFSLIIAASTSSIAWLLDPAIEKIFIEKDTSLILIIPAAIVAAFTLKGISLYMAKTIMIKVAQEVRKILQLDVMTYAINADTEEINKKHTGKFISHITFDVDRIKILIKSPFLNVFPFCKKQVVGYKLHFIFQ